MKKAKLWNIDKLLLCFLFKNDYQRTVQMPSTETNDFNDWLYDYMHLHIFSPHAPAMFVILLPVYAMGWTG